MCNPQVGRVANGIFTLGLSEAVRPMLGGGNKDLMDNMGAFSVGGPFSKPAQDFLNPKQPQANVPGTNMVAGSQPRQIR